MGEAEFRQADVQVHAFAQGECDVVVSRFGMMFFEDPHAAFANLARALRPGCRMVFVPGRT
ncbi:MAG: class I SAM-dependent methyltransferase [Acidimicrobiia bacterium]